MHLSEDGQLSDVLHLRELQAISSNVAECRLLLKSIN